MLTDKRMCPRVETEIPGKVSYPLEADEQDCILTNISLGGAFLKCASSKPIGTEIILRVDGFNNIPGVVARISDGGMGISFDCAPDAREKMAEKILRYLGGNGGGTSQSRRHERLQVPQARKFTRPTGELVNFSLLDLSLTGASLLTRLQPPIGEILGIGKSFGRVVRHFPQGVSVEFVTHAQ